MVTRVRQRLVRDREQRRGRMVDPAWANRTLLLRGDDTLSVRARTRLDLVFASDDPSDELSAAWGVKEQLRRLLTATGVDQARHEKMILGCYIVAADMEETWRLWRHQRPHRGREHRHQADQTDRPGYRNPAHYQARILLTSAARRAA